MIKKNIYNIWIYFNILISSLYPYVFSYFFSLFYAAVFFFIHFCMLYLLYKNVISTIF